MLEPGADEHAWASRFESLEGDVRDAPVEALSQLDELVAEMMEARRVTRLIDAGESYDPGDVANAVDAYRSLYEYLLHLGPASGSPA